MSWRERRGSNEILGEKAMLRGIVVFWEEAASALDYQAIAKKKTSVFYSRVRLLLYCRLSRQACYILCCFFFFIEPVTWRRKLFCGEGDDIQGKEKEP